MHIHGRRLTWKHLDVLSSFSLIWRTKCNVQNERYYRRAPSVKVIDIRESFYDALIAQAGEADQLIECGLFVDCRLVITSNYDVLHLNQSTGSSQNSLNMANKIVKRACVIADAVISAVETLFAHSRRG